jgi:hypothetical protein
MKLHQNSIIQSGITRFPQSELYAQVTGTHALTTAPFFHNINISSIMDERVSKQVLTDFLVYTGPTSDSIFVAVFYICKDGYNPAVLCIWCRLNTVMILWPFIL